MYTNNNNLAKIAHDILAPADTLSSLINDCTGITGADKIIFDKEIKKIRTMANLLHDEHLATFKTPKAYRFNSYVTPLEPVFMSALILNTLDMKRFEHSKLPIAIEHEISPESNFAFIRANELNVYRMLSNLINNAVDAFDYRSGTIKVKFDCQDNLVRITIEDNGKGMPAEVITKLTNNVQVTYGKANGHGIGFGQINDTIAEMNGTLRIDSELGKGTKMTICANQIKTPQWAITQLNLQADSIVIVVDHYQSTHEIWQSRFQPILAQSPDIVVRYFQYGCEALEYITTSPKEQKDRMILLTNYELFNEKFNGFEVALKSELEHTVLVADYNHELFDKLENYQKKLPAKLQTLPKNLIEIIPIVLNQ